MLEQSFEDHLAKETQGSHSHATDSCQIQDKEGTPPDQQRRLNMQGHCRI